MKQLTLAPIILLANLILPGCESKEKLTLETAGADAILAQAESHAGKQAVLVNFWATWCEPCVEEFPYIVELGREYESQDLQTYFVSVDFPDEVQAARDFLKSHNVNGLSYLAEQDDPNVFISRIHPGWTGAVPFTIVFAKSTGDVVDYWEGQRDKKYFERAMIKALKS